MKKIGIGIGSILVFMCILSTSLQVNAQHYYTEDDHRVFTGGLILGANISKVEDGDDFSHFHQIGFNTGGIVHINFSPSFSIALEMLYSQKGDVEVTESYSYAIGSYFAGYNLRLNYIEVPVTLHLKQNRFDYEIGMSYSRLISSDESISIDQPVYVDPLINYFNKTDYEFIIGGSYNVYKNLWFNVRWQYSVTPIRDYNRLPVNYTFDGQQNNVFVFRFVYML